MKIGLVSPYDFASPGGVVVHITRLYEQFISMGHSVRIIAPCSEGHQTQIQKDLITLGRPVPVPSGGSIARVTISPFLATAVKSILERENFDILHLHEPLGSTLTFTALCVSRSVNVATFHACHRVPRGYQVARPFVMKWFRRLDGKIAVSKPALQFVSRHFPGEYEIIPNGIDIERFSANVSPASEFCDGIQNILFVGRLERRKGLSYLLAAYRHVKRVLPDTRLIVVGPGKINTYQRLVKKFSLKDVVFVGYAPYNALPGYYQAAEVFCAPSTGEESFGIVLLEAMAASKPIVASAIQGYASVMTDGVEGLLVPPANEQALARALISLLNDEKRRREMGVRGRIVADSYSWRNITSRVMDYYQSLLARRIAGGVVADLGSQYISEV